VQGAGHYGIFSGKRWRNIAYPAIRDFIAAHDHAKPTAAAVAAPAARKRKAA